MNTICPCTNGRLTDAESHRGRPLATEMVDQLSNSLSCGIVHAVDYRISYLTVNSFSYLPAYRDSYRFAA